MKRSKKSVALLLSGLAIVGLAFGATLVLPASTQAAGMFGQAAPSAERQFPFPDRSVRMGGQDTYLADALDITVDELTAAREAASQAAIQQAVDEGLITQEQADVLLSRDRFGGRGFPGGRLGFGRANIDHQALLAEALDISVEALQDAQKDAADARLEQAVADGNITQEQADLIKAEQSLRDYLAATGVFENAVGQAVEDGVLTQEQADAILSGPWGGRGGFTGGMRGGSPFMGRGHRGMGGFPGLGTGDSTTIPQRAPALSVAPNATSA